MKSCSDTLKNFLASTEAKNLKIADLYTFTLVNGTVLRYTSASFDVVYNGNTYYHHNAGLKRGGTTQQVGLSVDTLNMEFHPKDTDYIGNMVMVEAFRNGIVDKAVLQLDIAYFTNGWDKAPEVISKWFYGRTYIAEDGIGNNIVKLEIKQNEEFSNKFPTRIYQAACDYTLYSDNCGAIKANFSETASVFNGSTDKIIKCSLSKQSGYYQNGVIEFTSGDNLNFKAAIKEHLSGTLVLSQPLPYTPNVGDTFTVSAGCNKTKTCCQYKFGNVFPATPFCPNPDSTLG